MMAAQIPRDVLSNCKILVVDDDPGSLMVATIILRHYGANVITATNGEEGLALVLSAQPNFIISDLSMPVMSGWVLIERLKENPATASIPIIALTAHAMNGDRERALAAGFNNYLFKPLTPSTFVPDLLKLLMDIPALVSELKL
jgi:CheY-like chemotaxis protein